MKKILLTAYLVISTILISNAQTDEVIPLRGNLSVNSFGQANYVLPIELPASAGGSAPSLYVEYNGSNNDGILGRGWRLGGLSSISRVGNSRLYDGKDTGVQMNSEGQFSLDGQRLILVLKKNNQKNSNNL